jgi:hypothetical protein
MNGRIEAMKYAIFAVVGWIGTLLGAIAWVLFVLPIEIIAYFERRIGE